MQKEEKRENERATLRKASCYGIERETRDIQFLSFFFLSFFLSFRRE